MLLGRARAHVPEPARVERRVHATELEQVLAERGQTELVEMLRRIKEMIEVVSVRQKKPLGLGHAVLCARDLVGDEPFAVMLADDLIDSDTPCIRQLLDIFEDKKESVIALMEVLPEDEIMLITRNGVIIRSSVAQIRVTGRIAQGVRLVNLDDGDILTAVARVIPEDDDGDIAGERALDLDTHKIPLAGGRAGLELRHPGAADEDQHQVEGGALQCVQQSSAGAETVAGVSEGLNGMG